MSYGDRVTFAMGWLARQEKTLFVGQSVRFDGQLLYKTLRDVPMERRIEMPVIEDFQLGYCTGLALAGFLPICIFPRMDFLIIAANQMINHLDKIPEMSEFRPKVIIRTAIGDKWPLNPGPQHTQDHVAGLRKMLKRIKIMEIRPENDPMYFYKRAWAMPCSTIVVETMAAYR